MKKLLITDLDNTLYDWVTFYAHAFESLVDALVQVLHVPRERLLDEFKAIHQSYGNSEQPFSALELPAVREMFPGVASEELVTTLHRPFEAFNAARREHLRLYDGVAETLRELKAMSVTIVGHTEALAVNAWYRLRTLDIAQYFSRLYALEGRLLPHPVPGREKEHAHPPDVVRVVPRAERKPNPKLLLDICGREGVAPADACCVGDSLTRDVWMAKRAGVTAVWARYGVAYDPKLWDVLVRVTHWSAEDVAREAELKIRAGEAQADYTIDAFQELVSIVGDCCRDA
jgi:phosphoglycolate phosphatase-like HAD superfamily hydrolase